MVLRLKTRESRSLPGLLKAMPIERWENKSSHTRKPNGPRPNQGPPLSGLLSFKGTAHTKTHGSPKALGQGEPQRRQIASAMDSGKKHHSKTVIIGTTKSRPIGAGWSSPVARQAHNLKAAGSNPAPATKSTASNQSPLDITSGDFCVSALQSHDAQRKQTDVPLLFLQILVESLTLRRRTG